MRIQPINTIPKNYCTKKEQLTRGEKTLASAMVTVGILCFWTAVKRAKR